MPCRSDYLEATQLEKDSRRFCDLLCYVMERLGKIPPDWAVKAKDEYYGNAAKVNDAAVKLCALIRQMSPEQLNAIVYDGRSARARKLADFWDAHEEADKRREAEESARLQAAKLSDEAEYERLRAKLGKP